MSELKATPGPWSIRCTGPHWNNPNLANIEINYGEDTECVCDTVYEMNDAHLITAAHDLYASNQELAQHVVELCAAMGVPLPEASIDRHKKAASKARGES